jgi:hypothetical protein
MLVVGAAEVVEVVVVLTTLIGVGNHHFFSKTGPSSNGTANTLLAIKANSAVEAPLNIMINDCSREAKAEKRRRGKRLKPGYGVMSCDDEIRD